MKQDMLMHRDLESLQEGKLVAIVPQGISMLPFIEGGVDQVFLLKKEKVEMGDIVLVEYKGKHILHRVYAIDGEKVVLMGDGNLEGTEAVMVEEVMGTVVEIVHKGRRRKPGKAWLWRHSLPLRRYMLKLHRKWNKLRASSCNLRCEVPRQK
jgi:hypothetical protein